jgi:AraC family transcriptional regulator
MDKNLGALVNRIECGDLVINATQYSLHTVLPRHEHAEAYVCVVAAGSYQQYAAGCFDCYPGSVVSHPAGHEHANRFGRGGGRCLSIHFGASWAIDDALRRMLADYRHIRLGSHARSLIRLTREMQSGDSAAPLAAASAALELLAEATRSAERGGSPIWLGRIIDMVEADLAHAPTLTALAAEVGIHPAHLARTFRRLHGETIGEYVRRRRVEEAERALAGELSIAQIAAAAGFADQAHFSRVFRRHFGESPGARRRGLQISFKGD